MLVPFTFNKWETVKAALEARNVTTEVVVSRLEVRSVGNLEFSGVNPLPPSERIVPTWDTIPSNFGHLLCAGV